MAKTVIDLISSSPPNPPKLPSPTRNLARDSANQEVEILSDDFDSPFASSDFVLSNTNGNKRRRVTRSPPSELPSGKPSERVPDPALAPRNSLSSDGPFASSSPRPVVQPLEALPDEPLDPFASSPLPVSRSKDKTPVSRLHSEVATNRHQEIEAISSPVASQTKPKTRPQQWDPISSSAPEVPGGPSGRGQGSGACHSTAIDIGSESDSESDDLPDIKTIASRPPIPRPRAPLQRSRSDVLSTRRPKQARPKAATRDAEKERKRRERQLEKETKAQEKERAAALAEANKMRDKKASAQEMTIDLPSSLSSTTRTQTEAILEGLLVPYTTWESSQNIIKWRRKVTTRFNEGLGLWEPAPPKTVSENHVAVILTADEFVALAQEGVGTHVTQLRATFPRQNVIYILEGLTPWFRKNRNVRNRQFTSGVRSQEAPTASGSRRRNAATAEYIPEDVIEDALMELQVMHDGILIHHTTVPLETAQWLAIFTQHISTIPYKKQKDQADVGFCMESGQVKTGEDAKDTYVRALQEIARVTAPIAYGVAGKYATITELVNGLEKGGPLTLEGVQKTVNRDGVLSDKTVGQAVSRRLHKVFTGRDASSTDV